MSVLQSWARMLVPLTALVGCDHATKYVAKSGLESQPPRAVIGSVLDFRYVENTDVGFNLLRWIPAGVRMPLLLGIGALAIAALLVFVLRSGYRGWAQSGLLLILGGALGNYLDRLARGYVVDFIHVPHWPVFNVADIWLTVGALVFFAVTLRQPRAPAPT